MHIVDIKALAATDRRVKIDTRHIIRQTEGCNPLIYLLSNDCLESGGNSQIVILDTTDNRGIKIDDCCINTDITQCRDRICTRVIVRRILRCDLTCNSWATNGRIGCTKLINFVLVVCRLLWVSTQVINRIREYGELTGSRKINGLTTCSTGNI